MNVDLWNKTIKDRREYYRKHGSLPLRPAEMIMDEATFMLIVIDGILQAEIEKQRPN